MLLGFLLWHYTIRTSLFMCTKGQRGANPIPRSVVVHAQVRHAGKKPNPATESTRTMSQRARSGR